MKIAQNIELRVRSFWDLAKLLSASYAIDVHMDACKNEYID